MRRFLPLVIIAVGLAAIAIDFAPLDRPFSDPAVKIDTRLALDLQGGLRGEYRALPANGVGVSTDGLANIRTIIENRINQFGVAEPIVQTQGSDRIVVEIPGVTNEQEVRALIGSTDAGLRAVNLTLTDEGARLFDQYAAAHYGEQFAIVLDNIVESAPVIRATRFGGQAQISGSFTSQAEVNQLVTVLNYGALPNAIEEVSFSKISPTLGLNFLQQSLLAGAIGIALVFVFMLLHYRLPGVVACIALIYYALVVFAIFRLVPVTLTLAGVAAFVLSVGMAVDANILIFERMKEELRIGRNLMAALEDGFRRAWSSIRDSNISTLITCAILYWFGNQFDESAIKGFAITLAIGVLVSMFSAIIVTRTFMQLVIGFRPFARRLWLFVADLPEEMRHTRSGRLPAMAGGAEPAGRPQRRGER